MYRAVTIKTTSEEKNLLDFLSVMCYRLKISLQALLFFYLCIYSTLFNFYLEPGLIPTFQAK